MSLRNQETWVTLRGMISLRHAPSQRYEKIFFTFVTFYFKRDTSVLELFPAIVFKGPVTLPKIRTNAWITHKIWLCVLVRREFDHFCWLTWWKITDELRKNYGKITHKSLTNHALQRIGTKRPQTRRMRGCAWRIRDGKPRIISALSLMNCAWIAHDSRMNCAKNAQKALKLRSFQAYKTDAVAVPWLSRFNTRRQHIVYSFKFVKFSFFWP